MKNIYIGIVGLIFLVLTGCGTKKSAPVYKKVHDTLIIEKNTTYRDTVFVTEKAKTSVISDCESLTESPKTSKNKNATQSLYRDKEGNIVADCECDTIALKAKIKSEFQKESQKSHIKEVEIKEVEYTPLLTKVFAWIGAVFIGCILITMSIKYIKNKFKQ